MFERDCVAPVNDSFPLSFAESGMFTERFIVAVCDDGASDWYEPMSESGIAFRYDAAGQSPFVTAPSDADTGRGCATFTSFGVGRTAAFAVAMRAHIRSSACGLRKRVPR
ncbi:MAG: hypothetical protein ACJAZO_000926 [Myxococcota bacterium]|jgi:hypothetical protein